MTVILALMATDCVAMAADSYAIGGDGVFTTGSSALKLHDIHARLVCGFAGDAGIEQRILVALRTQLSPEDCGQDIEALRPLIHSIMNGVQKQAVEEHVGHDPRDAAKAAALFAGVSDSGEPWIYEITSSGADERHYQKEAIGAGRVYARCMLDSNRHHGLEKLRERDALVIAFRAVDDAIVSAAHMGIGLPVRLGIARRSGAEVLGEDRMEGFAYQINQWQQEEREIFEDLATKRDLPPPSAPGGGPSVGGVQPPPPESE